MTKYQLSGPWFWIGVLIGLSIILIFYINYVK